ncbi:MAG: hypothetical protein NNA31_02860 [Nitrospira sp.]|nr:hypothetical protein [Nitrospira sp.]
MAQQGAGSVVVWALVAGLIGGVIGNRILLTDPVVAQEAAPDRRMIATERLIVTDRDGKARAQLAVSEEGEPRLDLADKSGKSRLTLALTKEDGAEVRLNSKDGDPRVRLAVLSKGEPRLDLTMERDGRVLASLGLSPEGWPELRLKGKEGTAEATLMFVDGAPRVFLEDKKGHVNAVLSAVEEKAGLVLYQGGKPRAGLTMEGLELINGEGQSRARLEILDTGEPRLTMKDKEGRRLVSLSVEALPKKEGPLLAMYDDKDALRAGLNLDEAGRPNLILRDRPLLSLIDRTGDDGVFLSIEGENRPSLLLSSKKGKHSAFLGLRENNEMALDLLDESNKQRASISLDPEGEPSMRLRDKTGRVIWSVTKEAATR